MYIYEEINFSAFCDRFHAYGRSEDFSYEAKQIIFDYLEDIATSTGEPIELDVIAICCDFTELPLETALEEYGLESFEELEDRTLVFKVPNSGNVLFQAF